MAHYSFVTLAFVGAILFSASASATATSQTGDKVNGIGAWSAENDPHLRELEELAQYAVAAHNLLSNHQLTFEHVVRCDDLPGLTHRLTIRANDQGVSKTYEAIVMGHPWMQVNKLISFRLSA